MTNDTDERTTASNDDDSATGGRSPGGDEGEAESTGDGPTDPTRIGAMDRRDYLRAVSAAAAVGGLGGAGATGAAAQTADTSLTVDERIQRHRTGDLEVVVENPDGTAVDGAQVSVTQREHEFGFGTAVDADTLIHGSSAGDNYREYVSELFNQAVLENRHKWAFWENERGLADDATDWLLDQGLDVRGHVCIWGRDGVAAIPDDVQTAIDEGDAETIRQRSMAHIEDIITHYGDDVTEWEVVNEAMHAYQLQLGVYGDQIDTEEPWTGEVVPWTSELLADWYGHAASVVEANDLDVGIAVNDYNQFAYDYADQRYETEIDHVNENGAQLDAVGLQAHVAARTGENDTNSNPDARLSAGDVASELNQWADHGARLRITEFDTYQGDDWNGDQERADVMENYLRGAFSHPAVDDFVVWGFWDGRHWRDEAPLFYRDWSEKPAYDVWTGLVFEEWWTDESGTTGDDGSYATTAFLGEHEVTVSTDAGSATATTSVTDADGATTVTVTVEGSGGGDGDATAPSQPTDLSVPATTASSVDVTWDPSSDSGGTGLDRYTVSVDGGRDHTVEAGTTATTVSDLAAETTYDVGVSAVDGAGNESDTATVEATTAAGEDGGDETPDDALVVNDYDGDPAWSSNQNDLGQWCGAGSFENGSGDVVEGALRLEYDGGGWFQEQINRDVSEYSTLVFRLSGANGGEESDVQFSVGGVDALLSDVTTDSVGTSVSDVTVDLESAGVDRSASGLSLRLNFWQGGASTLEIESIRLE